MRGKHDRIKAGLCSGKFKMHYEKRGKIEVVSTVPVLDTGGPVTGNTHPAWRSPGLEIQKDVGKSRLI